MSRLTLRAPPSSRLRPGRAARYLVLALMLSSVLVGAVWLVLELGDVPHYIDSNVFLKLADSGQVHPLRGFLYPRFLSAVEALIGDREALPRVPNHEIGTPCPAAPGFKLVQLIQLVVYVPCLLYFLRAFRRSVSTAAEVRQQQLALVGLMLLLFFDPLVAHFNLSVMADGLALSGSLLYCGAVARLLFGRGPGWLAAIIMAVAHFALAGLRPEKNLVVMGTVVTCVVLALLAPRRLGLRRAAFLSRRGLPALAIMVVVFGMIPAVRASLPEVRLGRLHPGSWPLHLLILHQRVIFPHLEDAWEDLPRKVRRIVRRAEARRYDQYILEHRRLVPKWTGGNHERLEQLTLTMAATVWRRHAGRILLDVAKDTAENVAATISFYSRLGIYAVTGEERFRQLFRADGTRWTYVQLRHHHPGLSRLLVGMTGLLFGVAMLVALVAPRASSVGVDVSTKTSILGAWLVTGVFAVVNGAAFAASADIVHIRYALLAHVLVLMLVYGTTLRWALAKRSEATA